MAKASGTTFAFEASKLPALGGALDLARAGVETGGAAHNRRFVAPYLTIDASVAPELVTLAHDPQTSGGLLAAIPAHLVAAVEADLADGGVENWAIGHVEAADGAGVELRA
jgi:selenide,water dikinase